MSTRLVKTISVRLYPEDVQALDELHALIKQRERPWDHTNVWSKSCTMREAVQRLLADLKSRD